MLSALSPQVSVKQGASEATITDLITMWVTSQIETCSPNPIWSSSTCLLLVPMGLSHQRVHLMQIKAHVPVSQKVNP